MNQRQMQTEAHLNEIKRKLLDLAMEGIDDPSGASKKTAVIMRGSDFTENLSWFWGDVSKNELLRDTYFGNALAPMASGSMGANEAVAFLDGFDRNARGLVGWWLSSQSAESVWRSRALPLFHAYEQVLQQRQAEQNRRNAEQARCEAERQAALAKKEAEEAPRRLREAARARAVQKLRTVFSYVAALLSTLLFAAGFVFGGWYLLPEALGKKRYSVIVFFALLLIAVAIPVFKYARAYVSKSYDGIDADALWWWLYVGASALILIFTWRSWSSLGGIPRIVLLGATIGVPLISYVRGAIGVAALGIPVGAVSIFFAFVASNILNWIMSNH